MHAGPRKREHTNNEERCEYSCCYKKRVDSPLRLHRIAFLELAGNRTDSRVR